MIVQASGQFWKLKASLAVGLAMGVAVWWLDIQGILRFFLWSFLFAPAMVWSLLSLKCPRCRDRWLWRQATTGKSPSLQPVFQWTACPACGLTEAEMVSGEWVANDGLDRTPSGGRRIVVWPAEYHPSDPDVARTLTEVDDGGRVLREIGVGIDGKVVYIAPALNGRHPHGLFDLQRVGPAPSEDEFPRAEFEALWLAGAGEFGAREGRTVS